jgi:hypothetical protein
VRLTGDWRAAARRCTALRARVDAALARAGAATGPWLAARVREGLASQAPGGRAFAPLHPVTVARKGGATTALSGGALEHAVTCRVSSDGRAVWVGVPADARGDDGRSLAVVARAHEFGAVLDVTPAMRAWLHHAGLHLAMTTTTIVLPARPFVGPTLSASVPMLRAQLRDAFATTLRART